MSSLYLHIPFCSSKCQYCDFFSLATSSSAERDEYVDLLGLELQRLVRKQQRDPLQSIFFGGGTPSLLTVTQVDRLLRQLDTAFGFAPEVEISMEANPGTLDQDKLAGYQQAGVNRLSLGVQTFNDRQLQTLGRLHSAAEARRAVAMARQAGFDNLSLDLIFALPGQTLRDLQQDVQEFCELAPEHLSCYGLTVEAGTPLEASVQKGRLELPDDDYYAEAFLCLHESLTAAGYVHYEISNYARPGFACRHNLGYWQRQSCFGLGAGAHSFSAAGWGERRATAPDLAAYRHAVLAGRDPTERLEVFDRTAAMRETLYLGLRTRTGVENRRFREIYGVGVAEAFPEGVAQLRPWLDKQGGCWRMQPKGWLLFDHLIQAFL